MKSVSLIAAMLAITPMAALAQTPSSLSCIRDITYSQEFLARYPKAGAACREVIVKDGQKWVRFDADVVQKHGRRITADFIDKFGHSVGVLTLEASPDARLTVNDHPMPYSLLQPGDKLSFWMPESRVGFYAAPGALTSTQLAVIGNPAGTVPR